MATLTPQQRVDKLCFAFAEKRAALTYDQEACRANLREVLSQYLPGIRKQADKLYTTHADLTELVRDNPQLFTDGAKTQINYGIEVGFRKQPDSVGAADDNLDFAIETIKASGPKNARAYLRVKTELDKAALKKLTDEQLAALNCVRTYGGDEALVKPADGELDKYIAMLVPDAKEVM